MNLKRLPRCLKGNERLARDRTASITKMDTIRRIGNRCSVFIDQSSRKLCRDKMLCNFMRGNPLGNHFFIERSKIRQMMKLYYLRKKGIEPCSTQRQFILP